MVDTSGVTTHNQPGQGQTNPYPQPTYPQPNYGGQPPQWGPTGQMPQPPKKKGGKVKWIVLGIFAFLLIVAIANGGNSTPATQPVAAPVVPQAPAAAPVVPAPLPASPAAPEPYNGFGPTTAKYGQKVMAGDLEVTAAAPTTISQQFLGSQVCATVSYRNTGSTPESFSMFDWKFRTANGVETNASLPFNAGESALNTGQLAAGGTTSGKVCGDQQTKNVTALVFSPGFGVMHQVTFTK